MLETCPRCRGSGRELSFPNMICGGCSGDGKVKQGSLCLMCYHPKRSHLPLKNLRIVHCEDESASGSSICGCIAQKPYMRSICSSCGRDCGNLYCLDRHLKESQQCKANFQPQFYKEL